MDQPNVTIHRDEAEYNHPAQPGTSSSYGLLITAYAIGAEYAT